MRRVRPTTSHRLMGSVSAKYSVGGDFTHSGKEILVHVAVLEDIAQAFVPSQANANKPRRRHLNLVPS